MIDEPTRLLLDTRLARDQAEERLPSVAAGLVRDGELIWTAGRGRVGGAARVGGAGGAGGEGQAGDASQRPDTGTQYRAGSITKTFTATAVLRLRDAGRLSLDDPIGDYLDAGSASSMTIGHLLAHSAGLRAETAGPWWERTEGTSLDELTASSLGEDAARFRAGRRHHYSNLGYGLLGALLSVLHGRPWFEVIAAELLAPLGMKRTTMRPQQPFAAGFAVHPHADVLLAEPEHDAGAMAPAGQLWTTVGDLARWGTFLAGDTGGLLAPDTLAEMREPVGLADAPGQPWTAGYGLGLQLWNEGGVRYYGHTGSMPGFVAVLRITDAPGSDTAIAMCNSTTGFSPALGQDLLTVLAERAPRCPPEWAPADVPADLLAMLGTWYWGPAQHTLSLAGQILALRREPYPDGMRFRRDQAGRWRGIDGYFAGEPLVPVRAADGTVTALDVGTFIFTRTPYDPAAPVPGGVHPRGWHPGTTEIHDIQG
jgi:CubicO group peptidase (beta-lactamase class C family)